MKNFLKIGHKKIGDKFKPFIICELGINHNGSLKLAKKMVDLAHKSGADAIKNQRHILDKEMIPEAKKIKPANADSSIYDVIKKTNISGVSASSLLHYDTYMIFPFNKNKVGNFNFLENSTKKKSFNNLKRLKLFLKRNGVNVRL